MDEGGPIGCTARPNRVHSNRKWHHPATKNKINSLQLKAAIPWSNGVKVHLWQKRAWNIRRSVGVPFHGHAPWEKVGHKGAHSGSQLPFSTKPRNNIIPSYSGTILVLVLVLVHTMILMKDTSTVKYLGHVFVSE